MGMKMSSWSPAQTGGPQAGKHEPASRDDWLPARLVHLAGRGDSFDGIPPSRMYHSLAESCTPTCWARVGNRARMPTPPPDLRGPPDASTQGFANPINA